MNYRTGCKRDESRQQNERTRERNAWRLMS